MPPLVAHAFCPFSTHSPAASSNLPVVRTPEMSDPAFGSDAQNAATLISSVLPKQRGIHSAIASTAASAASVAPAWAPTAGDADVADIALEISFVACVAARGAQARARGLDVCPESVAHGSSELGSIRAA